jgi:cobalt/nickel transport system permease protein
MPVSAFIAAWLACVIPALCAAVELWFAGTFPLEAGLFAMGLYYAVIGVVEGVITVAAIYLIVSVRPDMVDKGVLPAKGGAVA